MTDYVIDLPLPDQAARARIAEELESNLLVEAGAGSGKTTALVHRLVALIETGTATVDEIAAVTFTRKAAAELRERFQTELERRLRAVRVASDRDEIVVDRLRMALDDVDRAFVGTIHSFCARLLRERPLEVGIDPAFEELPVEERVGLRRRFWESYLERLARDSDPILEDLARAGLRPTTLFGLFDKLVENPDVDFPTQSSEMPSLSDVGSIRRELEEIVDRGWELMDDVPPPRGWDSLQRKIRQLHFDREVTGWKEPADFFEAIAVLCKPGPRGHSATFNRWRQPDMAKDLLGRADAFGVGDTEAQRLVDAWYAHRYALAVRLGQAAAGEFAAHRLRMGKLDFQDLLVLAARLLRTRPDVRRQLGRRYRRLLVDEFQDTDPLQAEIMLLLSSEPGDGEGDGEEISSDWRVATPRPGALFVVGDPKQSIYRFRRADIQLYGFVKRRFASFGDVVALSTNFRSRPAVGDLVNELFPRAGFFPAEATPEQAAFERLDTRPATDPVPAEGVFVYELDPFGSRKEEAAADDAARLTTWIRDRVDAGERRPEDFLVLTRDRGQLGAYARAFEEYSLPVQVTGAGVGVEAELRELEVLLECMIDPGNPVAVVAVLVGLFFGIDYERLVAHRLEGGGLDAMAPGERGDEEVLAGLRRMHGWWRASTVEPADVFVGRLVAELGLLPHAAAGELGTLRAGALLYALDAVRAAALAGDASLPGALAALRDALDLREAEAPLEPGRPDAVRLMNLHQAKGLEATVVVLANPTDHTSRKPDAHMTRSEAGVAEGFLRVSGSSTGWGAAPDLARPVGWADRQEAEERFEAAEEVRLLYVAVTRAKEELVVARWKAGRGTSPWAALDPWLDEHAESLPLAARPPVERPSLEMGAAEAHDAADAARSALQRLGEPGFRHLTVTEVTKEAVEARPTEAVRDPEVPLPHEGFRGFSWGSAVHGALAIAASGAGQEALYSVCRDLLVEHDRPLDDHGEPHELRELVDLVESVRASELWERAARAERSMVEVAFALPDPRLDESGRRASEPRPGRPSTAGERAGTERRQLDLFGLASAEAGVEADDLETAAGTDPVAPGIATVLEGVVDLAFREADGWVIADYKTDVGTDPDFARRSKAYRRQVELYADAWSRLTGEPVKERVLFYTSQGRVERW